MHQNYCNSKTNDRTSRKFHSDYQQFFNASNASNIFYYFSIIFNHQEKLTQNSTSCTGSPLPWWSSPAALAPRRCRCPQYHTERPPCYYPPLCPPGPPSLAGPQSHCLGRSPLGISLCSDHYPGYLQKLKYHQYKQV